MNSARYIIVVLTVFVASTTRLPAPIVEETTPPPATKRKTESKSSFAKPAAAAESGMNSRSVQVVVTDNTRAAILYLKNRVQQYESQPLAGKSDVHPDEIFQQLRQALGTRFNNVSILDGSSSRSEGLTMIFDLQAKVGTISFTTNTISFTATFKNSAGRTLQTISASGKSMVPYPGFFGTQFSKAVSGAFSDFSQKLAVAR